MITTETRVDVEEFFTAIEDIEFKNHGGCLLFCYTFWLWLKSQGHETDTFAIFQHSYRDVEIEHNRNWIANKTGTPVSAFHFTWEYQGTRYDGTGEYDVDAHVDGVKLDLIQSDVDLTEEFCEKSLNDVWQWNDTFDRSYAAGVILNNLGICLDHVAYCDV